MIDKELKWKVIHPPNSLILKNEKIILKNEKIEMTREKKSKNE
jgi:hypothetical protein